MERISIFVLILIVLIQSAIIDNCMQYATVIEPQKALCLECRDGFYLKSGTCMECTALVSHAECKAVKSFAFGSNIAPNSTSNSSNVLNIQPAVYSANAASPPALSTLSVTVEQKGESKSIDLSQINAAEFANLLSAALAS